MPRKILYSISFYLFLYRFAEILVNTNVNILFYSYCLTVVYQTIDAPYLAELPDVYSSLGGLDKILLLKFFRKDKVLAAIRAFVDQSLGNWLYNKGIVLFFLRSTDCSLEPCQDTPYTI